MFKQGAVRDGASSVRDAVVDFERTAGEPAPWLGAIADLPAVFLCGIKDD